jgi:hypothetical protein
VNGYEAISWPERIMEVAVPFTMLALIVFITGLGLLGAAFGFMVRRRQHSDNDAISDEVAALRGQVERLRVRIERIEKRDVAPSEAIKERP